MVSAEYQTLTLIGLLMSEKPLYRLSCHLGSIKNSYREKKLIYPEIFFLRGIPLVEVF
jgi:hypothetical protein